MSFPVHFFSFATVLICYRECRQSQGICYVAIHPSARQQRTREIGRHALVFPACIYYTDFKPGRLWRISDLEDSRGHYFGLLNTSDLRSTRIVSPDVRDEKGIRIHVSEYSSKLKEGAIIELEVILKL